MLSLLEGLALDSDGGRAARGGTVDDRTRSFALCGLGLFASEHSAPAIRRRVLTTLRRVLEDDRLHDRNLKVAAIEAIGPLQIDRSDTAGAAMLDDRRSVEPRKRTLFDESGSDLRRAFAAVALGAVADWHQLPWHQKLSADINHRASVETMTDQQAGVLDIL